MTKLLDGKVCIIAGAAAPKGIGLATARLFAEHGARLVLADITASDATALDFASTFADDGHPSPDVIAVTCDISDRQDCDRLVAAAVEHFGSLDVVVNSAGIVGSGPMLDIDTDTLDRMIAVNLKGAFNLCQAALEVFAQQHRGIIVNIASLAAQRGGGLVGGAHYAASKGGVVSLTRSIAREFGPLGIRANSICPAMAQTGMLDGLTEAQIDAITADIPLRRLGTPRDVAGACLYLASDLASFVTGSTLDVNGGLHIH
ncbi:MAG: SDR family NAD(P)-dependent oxidoreductase [Novosphingobium sp.]|nr:SDR family NAD(P)-dependent oxidoreductase [Novosphingobium sp.]